MAPSKSLAREPRWQWIPLRVLLATFLLALLGFAISLLLGILALVIAGRVRGVHPDMAIAYRYFALPAAAVAGVIGFAGASVLEIRHYRQNQTLAAIERISRSSS